MQFLIPLMVLPSKKLVFFFRPLVLLLLLVHLLLGMVNELNHYGMKDEIPRLVKSVRDGRRRRRCRSSSKKKKGGRP